MTKLLKLQSSYQDNVFCPARLIVTKQSGYRLSTSSLHIMNCLVRISVVDHQPSPLSHLTEVSVGVVEVLDGRDVGVRLQVEGELEARLVSEDAGQDGDVASLIEDLQLVRAQTESYQIRVISSLV